MAGIKGKSGRKATGITMETVYIKLPPEDVASYKRAAKAQGNLSLSAYIRTLLQQAKNAAPSK